MKEDKFLVTGTWKLWMLKLSWLSDTGQYIKSLMSLLKNHLGLQKHVYLLGLIVLKYCVGGYIPVHYCGQCVEL